MPSKEDLQAHLPEQHAYDLLKDALASYWDVHKTLPAHVVMHKSSRFDTNEKKGFEAALKAKGIARHDFLWVSGSASRLYRAGQYPPLRGTLLTLDEKGSVHAR